MLEFLWLPPPPELLPILPRPPAPNDELCDKAYEFDDMSGDADSSPYPGSLELSAIDIALKNNNIVFTKFCVFGNSMDKIKQL